MLVANELARAQEHLNRAIGRARAGEDRELAQKVREKGETLAHLLGGLLKMSRVHAADNRAFDVPLGQLASALEELVRLLGPVHLVAVEDQVYVNDVRVRSESRAGESDLGVELGKHNVGGLSFHAPLAAPTLRALVAAFAEKPAGVAPRQSLQKKLAEGGVRSVELAPRFRFRTEEREELLNRDPVDAIRRAVMLVAESFDNLGAGRTLSALPLRHAVVEMLEIGPWAPELWETVGEGMPHAAHAAAVALISLLVGRAVGLRASVLQDLGLAALCHDLGYAGLPREMSSGPEGLARHPAEGAHLMLRQHGYNEAKLRRLRAVLDHHRDHVEPRSRPSILGQILRLADDYTTLCRVHAGRISPADALGAMAQAAGRLYHPILCQVMVNVLGRYPPGTLLELEDGRYARSVSPARAKESFAAPLARLCDPSGRALSAERIDLAVSGAVRRALPG
ncbi:MAG TPA: HD domain-containing protein [Anaeromyxobacteraceae bacterium]|nr:HD domain-containing protein [Anaeromyxobacteraceae bacterium]